MVIPAYLLARVDHLTGKACILDTHSKFGSRKIICTRTEKMKLAWECKY